MCWKTSFKTLVASIAGALALSWSDTALPHHHAGAAIHDFSNTVAVEGIVKEFGFMNPHSRVVVSVSGADGQRDIEYECWSATSFRRGGYTESPAKAGDRIEMVIAPRYDGAEGGWITEFVANGIKVMLPSPSSSQRPAATQRQP
jgi:hypothetical protein